MLAGHLDPFEVDAHDRIVGLDSFVTRKSEVSGGPGRASPQYFQGLAVDDLDPVSFVL